MKIKQLFIFFEDILFTCRIIMGKRKRSYLPQIPSPDSSGKPMLVENNFFLVVAERLK